jgi:hypothetical protein
MIGDETYLLTHDDRTGGLKVPPSRASVGLAAGLLAELVMSGHLVIRDSRLHAVAAGAPPPDRLQRAVLTAVLSQPVHPVRTWLRFLADDAVEDVRDRLLDAGVLMRTRRTSLVRGRRVEYPPVSSNAAAWPQIRLSRSLVSGRELTDEDAVLVGLLEAMDLLDQVLRDEVERARGATRARMVRDGLPSVLASLVAQAEAVLADGVLAYRC